MQPRFVHLRVHTEYSLIDGVVRIKPMVQKLVDLEIPAGAITDHCNLFGLVKFYRAAIAAGIKPIIGCDIELQARGDYPVGRMTFLCQTNEGYKNLTRLISKAYLEGQSKGIPRVKFEWVQDHADGLIAIAGGRESEIGQVLLADQTELAQAAIKEWQRLFPYRFYLEVTRTGRTNEERFIRKITPLSAALGVPLVATNDVRFVASGDFEAHEARVCIHDGHVLDDERRPRRYSDQQYLRSQEEMISLFEDLPEAIQNTVEIAKRCNVELRLGENFLPDYPIPEGQTVDEYLTHLSQEGLEKRLAILFDEEIREEKRKPYDKRLQIELDVIIGMKFPGYFLVVADFIQWSKKNGVPVGPGRGSGAGSLVAYALGITDIDPLQYDLLFERFLNPERVSMPDFDVDFCMAGRDRVIHYVEDKYGREKVSQIITYGTMAAKAVVRDVGRVLGHPYGFVDRIAKLIPFELGITLDKALEDSDELREQYQQDPEVTTLIDLAKKLEGITRNAGKHAGGVVIAPTMLTDFAPLYCEEGGTNVVTQFDKDDVEAAGLVKFDFLGLRTLTIIDLALQTINEQRQKKQDPPLDITLIPNEDVKTFDLIKAGKTTAVFQLESRGMKELILRLQPDCFEDVIALVALFRPGPLQSGMVDDFIDRKHGRASVEYPHPDLKSILKPTYGVILYQEQVMQIAQVLAGYTLGGADLLRRAMGKKKPEEMAKQRAIFVAGATKRKVNEAVATHIFDLMEKFAGYGFNKSHSAAYAAISYQTAWLKAHYPAEFMAAVMSSDMDNTDKVVGFIEDARQMGIKVIAPDVNRGQYKFTVNQENTIIYGLGAIKGVGQGAIEGIVQSRAQNGLFVDLFDFVKRIDLQKANRRTLEAMIRAGALDSLWANRSELMANLSAAIHAAEQDAKNQALGQADMFGGSAGIQQASPHWIEMAQWTDEERLQGEKETLGLYLTGHPIDRFTDQMKSMRVTPIARLVKRGDTKVKICGLITGLRIMKTKRGDPMAIITLDDKSGRMDVTAFSEAYNEGRNCLVKDNIIMAEGALSVDEFTQGYKLTASRLCHLALAHQERIRAIRISLEPEQLQGEGLKQLQTTLKQHHGRCPVRVKYVLEGTESEIILGNDWGVNPSDALMAQLTAWLGQDRVESVY